MLNVFDIGIVFILLIGLVIGFKRGVIKEAVSLVGIIAVFILSFSLKNVLGNILCQLLPFFKFKGVIAGISTLNILMYQLIAFTIIFSILFIIYEMVLVISKILQKIVNLTLVLLLPSKLLGALISFIKTYIVLTIVFIILMIPIGNSEIYKGSTFVQYMLHKTPIISKYTSNFVKPVKEIYDLATNINEEEKNETNLKALDIMLKYKVVDKKAVENLVKFHKLDDVDNIESVLNNY